MQHRVIMVTDPPTHKQTGPITIHCATVSVQCNYYTAAWQSGSWRPCGFHGNPAGMQQISWDSHRDVNDMRK